MAKDYAKQSPTAVRRSDRQVEDIDWIKQFLKTASVGTLATTYEGQPFVNTNIFVYDEESHSIITHTARVGRTRANVEVHDKVCFSIMEMGRLLPAAEALEFSVEYAGVTLFGTMSVVDDVQEAKRLLQLLMDKYAPHLKPGDDYRPPVDEELPRTSVFRIKINDWSGKKKEVASDFPGAFWYPEQPILTSNQD